MRACCEGITGLIKDRLGNRTLINIYIFFEWLGKMLVQKPSTELHSHVYKVHTLWCVPEAK